MNYIGEHITISLLSLCILVLSYLPYHSCSLLNEHNQAQLYQSLLQECKIDKQEYQSMVRQYENDIINDSFIDPGLINYINN